MDKIKNIKSDLKSAPIPNIITSARLILGMSSLVFFLNSLKIAMVISYGASALTDWVDGIAARKLNQQTKTGAAFDAISDKLLTVIGGIIGTSIAGPAVLGLFLGEGLIGLVNAYRRNVLKSDNLQPTLIGKIKEWPLKITFGVIMLSTVIKIPNVATNLLMGLTGVLQGGTIASYIKLAKQDKKDSEIKIEEEKEVQIYKKESKEMTKTERIKFLKNYKENMLNQEKEKPLVYVKKGYKKL